MITFEYLKRAILRNYCNISSRSGIMFTFYWFFLYIQGIVAFIILMQIAMKYNLLDTQKVNRERNLSAVFQCGILTGIKIF